MNAATFEAQLKADGFGEAITRELQAGPANGEHDHPFTARGLILAGAFTVTVEGVACTYRPGEIFEVPAGRRHFEQVGPDGAQLLVGRKA